MLSKEEAIVSLQKHIDTYHVQLTDGGWERMVKMGIAKNTIQEKILFVEDDKKTDTGLRNGNQSTGKRQNRELVRPVLPGESVSVPV